MGRVDNLAVGRFEFEGPVSSCGELSHVDGSLSSVAFGVVLAATLPSCIVVSFLIESNCRRKIAFKRPVQFC